MTEEKQIRAEFSGDIEKMISHSQGGKKVTVLLISYLDKFNLI
jgi:hypothetical protein